MRLDFVAAGASQGLVAAAAARAGVEVAGSFGAVGAMLERFNGGDACDIVILTAAQIEALAAKGAVVPETCADLGAVATSIAVRRADAVPDVSSEDALRRTLLAADEIYFPDPAKATAGIHFAKVIDALGVRAAVDSRCRTFPNGATAMRHLAAASGRPIGCTQATEILATEGVKLVAPLPPPLGLETVYTAAVSARASQPAQARDFVRLLTADESRRLRLNAGFH